MNIKVSVPLSLHKLTGNKTEFICQGETVEELLTTMNSQYPGIRDALFDEEGKIIRSYSLFVNGRIVKLSESKRIRLNNGDKVLIMQLVAGG